MAANRFGKRKDSTVIISPSGRGMGVVLARGRLADNAFEKLGWTQGGSQFVAPVGWKTNATIFQSYVPMPHGVKLFAFTYFDRDTERQVTVCTGEDEKEKQADRYMINRLKWKLIKNQWVAP